MNLSTIILPHKGSQALQLCGKHLNPVVGKFFSSNFSLCMFSTMMGLNSTYNEPLSELVIREDLMRRLLGKTQQVVLTGVQISTGNSFAGGLNFLARNSQISSLNSNMIQSGAVSCSIYHHH